jgi:hypothetical protein
MGGGVSASGEQPGYAAGHVDPLEHTCEMQVWAFAPQLSQSFPNCPHAAFAAPLKQLPFAVQQPAQLSGPQ